MSPKRTSLLLVAGLMFSALAHIIQTPAAETPSKETAEAHQSTESPSTSEPVLPPDAVTSQTLILNKGGQINYTATAGSVTLTDAQGGKTAEIFYVSYILSGTPPTKRPITFVFNGGPGASSAYLHMAAIGPRVLDFGNGRSAITPDGKAISNPDSWLSFTDLVFVDPVGTGYSRAKNSVKDVGKAFWGVNEDLDALGKSVWLILAKHDRIGSPVYLAGESYGGFRTAKLIKHLPADQGIAVTGATLISPVLKFSLLDDDDFNPLTWAFRLPSYAAVALESRDKLSPEALQSVEQFALGEYLTTLAATPPDTSKNSSIYAAVAKTIGLPESLVARWNGRVPVSVFTKEIHHETGDVASPYDGSVDGADPYPSAPKTRDTDPIFENIIAPLTTSFVAYLRDELKFKTERPYALLNREVSRKWNWERDDPSEAVGADDDLREGLALNPNLKIAVVHGMTDLVTPYMTSRYVITRLPIQLTQGRLSLDLLPGGHMMYLRPDSRAALARSAQSIYPHGE
ncbi:carboxypeptidase C (cathepsin A) [Hyphomicrobium denitrificans 1NES1]|uniref:Carboxypeptidase C (Cathepsin A) n=1 Tax=Hyphomicrobium denitrificans 1NES1 TaxID=670307 RepID=N0B465_9HYPH|nr:carboxypeptidase C (cathepsin A) [Hyphomicrobium denitrificans]AGK58314.1 carboxypeptidase C (cathepsin A) [Hyphomicrobium denitrificans 1NES1]